MNEVIKLARTQRSPREKLTRAPSKAMLRKLWWQRTTGVATGVVALTLTGLSLSHLAHGTHVVTGASVLDSWMMAIGIDLGFIALEFCRLNAAPNIRKRIASYTMYGICGTLSLSAVLNAFAFTASSDGWWMLPAALMGLAIPGLIYLLTRVTAAMLLDQ